MQGMETAPLANLLAVGTAAAVLAALFTRRIRESLLWRATVTPLASIIGSGFLIVAPLLHSITGRWSLAAMAGLAGFSYAVGAVVRFNIAHAEPWIDAHPGDAIHRLDQAGQFMLGASYAISVAFYTRLFIAFLLERVGPIPAIQPEAMTTILLLMVAAVAWLRGTRGLEVVELVAVSIKLAIIAGVLVALATYDLSSRMQWFAHEPTENLTYWETAAILAGMLMVTQGFETSRFMGAHYQAGSRIRASRNAQLIALVIYTAFIGLTCPIFLEFPIVALTETTISATLGMVVFVLPAMLLVAATTSQLSAALADTIGGGGLLRELAPGALEERQVYLILIGIGIAIVWSTDVFGIINFASKGFALFYLVQTMIAMRLLWRAEGGASKGRILRLLACAGVALALSFVVLFSIPAPHG